MSTQPWSPATWEAQQVSRHVSQPVDRLANGAFAVITRSFARIHETNLKKQGMLPLTFKDAADYDKITPDDKVDLHVSDIAVGKPVTMKVHTADGKTWDSILEHSFNAEQLEWFKNGSALNTMAKKAGH